MKKNPSFIKDLNTEYKGCDIPNSLNEMKLSFGSLERNLHLHNRLLNQIPETYNKSKISKKLILKPFYLLLQKIQDVETRIEKYISLMLESEKELPELAFRYIRLQDIIKMVDEDPTTAKLNSDLSDLKKENKYLNNTLRVMNKKIKILTKKTKFKLGSLTNDQLEQIADSSRKKNGKLNYADMGRKTGHDPKTVKNEIDRRRMSYLKNPPS